MPKKTLASADREMLDKLWSEPVERTVLANGLTVLVKADRSAALASVQVWVRTGSIHEEGHLGAGLSHYLEHMLFKGTERRAGKEISATVQAHGGYINAYTTFDRTVYYIDLPSEGVEVAVDVLADAVLHSTLPEDEVAREKDVILREIAMVRDDPDSRLWEALFSTAFREHPYRQPIIGHRDVFAAADRAALVDYYRRRYVPNNMVVVITGDVEPASALALVERHFGAAPRSRLAPVLVPVEPLQLGPRTVRRVEKVEIVRAVLAWPIPGLADPEAPALDLLGLVLGGGESSVLWQEIRDKRNLVHSIDASSWNPGTSGLFCISFVCDAGKREEAEREILRVVRRCGRQRPFLPAEVRKAYRQSVVSEINTRKTMSGQASRLGAAEVVIGDLEFGRTYFGRLARVGPSELARTLARHLVAGRMTSVSIEPAGAEKGPGSRAAQGGGGRTDFDLVRLQNGARILLQEDRHLPNVHFRLITLGGPLVEEPSRRGSSSLLATLLTKDTARRSAARVAGRIEEVGGSFSSFSGDNTLGLLAEVLPADVGLAVELLSEGACSPAFRPETLSTERDAQLAALREENDDVVALARRLLRRRFFGSHPMAIGPNGDMDGVRSTGRGDLTSLWKRLLVGPVTVLSVAGDFRAKALLPRLEAFLASVPRGRVPAPPEAFTGPAEAGDFVEIQPREQAVVLQGFPGSPIGADDFYAGEVADELFSGMASRLFERVRDQKGLAYFIRSGRVATRGAAMFFFIAGTQPGKEAEVLGEIATEISRVADGDLPAEEIARCKARLKAGHRKMLQTNSSRAMQSAIDVLQGRGPNFWREYDSLVDLVTAADLSRYARLHLLGPARTQLVVRP
jgi:zinc protease